MTAVLEQREVRRRPGRPVERNRGSRGPRIIETLQMSIRLSKQADQTVDRLIDELNRLYPRIESRPVQQDDGNVIIEQVIVPWTRTQVLEEVLRDYYEEWQQLNP